MARLPGVNHRVWDGGLTKVRFRDLLKLSIEL